MSRIENLITTTFRATGGNVVSFMGELGTRTSQWGRVLSDNTRLSERLNAQWRAIGTTIRYALAGTATFGAVRLIGQLRDINQQLGQMQALSGIGGTAFSDRQITDLGDRLQRTALDTITPLNEVNDAAINFLSTVQNVEPSQLPDMLTQIGQGAKLAQTPIETLTQAATTFQVAFRRAVDPTSVGQFTRMWSQLIGVAPGVITAAPTIAQSIPGLASMFQLAPGRNVPANVGQAQLMGLTLGVLRTGMPPATAMRGLTYLLQSIAQPTGAARGALAGIGITPQTVEQQGIYANLMKLLRTVTNTGNPQQLAAIPDETLDALGDQGNLPGIPAAEMTRLRAMIPRIHGIRAAIILASQLQAQGNVESISGDVNMMLQAQNQNSDTTADLRKAWENLSRRSRLQQASVAVNTMALQIASVFNPVFDFISSGVALHLAPWMQNHRKAVRDIAIGGTAFVGAMTVSRALGLGNLPGIRNVPGLRGLLGAGGGRAFLAENAVRAAATGGLGLGASPQNPLYVVVVGQIFGDAVLGGPQNAPSSPSSKSSWIDRAAGYLAGTARGAAGLRGALKWVGRGAMGLAEAPAIGDFISAVASGHDVTTGQPVGRLDSFLGIGGDFKNARDYRQSLARAQRLYPGTAGIKDFRRDNDLRGRAEVYMTLDMVDANGKHKTQRVHVPIEMWSGGRVPVTRGRPGKGSRP